MKSWGLAIAALLTTPLLLLTPARAAAQAPPGCESPPNADRLRSMLQSVVTQGPRQNGGVGLPRYSALGECCALCRSRAARFARIRSSDYHGQWYVRRSPAPSLLSRLLPRRNPT